MMFQRRFLCALTLALATMFTFTGCQSAPKPEEKRDAAAETKAINALRAQFIAAFNSNDSAAAAALYTDDAIIMPPNQDTVEGRQAIQAFYAAMFKQNAAKIALTPLETRVADDWAYDRGTATTTITQKSAKSGKPIEEPSKYLVIVKRQSDGSWKVYREIGNGNAPPSRAPAAKKKAKRRR
jgi:uncharacterized protein (TIGR02246 family)